MARDRMYRFFVLKKPTETNDSQTIIDILCLCIYKRMTCPRRIKKQKQSNMGRRV